MNRTILIVDDSATTRAVIRRCLRMAGVVAEMLEASDGQQALVMLRARRVDLVLMDLHMPVKGGAEVVGEMHADPELSHVPVVIVSSDSLQGGIDELRRMGVAGYVKKPFTPVQVRDVLQQVLPAVLRAA